MSTLIELRNKAKSYGMVGYIKLNKKEIINQIRSFKTPTEVEVFNRSLASSNFPATRNAFLKKRYNPEKLLEEQNKRNVLVDKLLIQRNHLKKSKVDKTKVAEAVQKISVITKKEKVNKRIRLRDHPIYENLREPEEGVVQGRRFIQWSFYRGVSQNISPKIMEKINANIQSSCYIRYSYSYEIRNNDDGREIPFHKVVNGSPWINKLVDAGTWLNSTEEERLNPDNIDRPNTRWVFVRFISVTVRVIKDTQPLLGSGQLPDWLRNLAGGSNTSMVTLDSYNDGLCFWRCLAVYTGKRPDRCTVEAKKWASYYYNEYRNDYASKITIHELPDIEEILNRNNICNKRFGVRVYEPVREANGNIVWRLVRNPPVSSKNVMTIGIFNGHAFLIKDIAKLAKLYSCNHCEARFTRHDNLERHYKICNGGKTKIVCKNKKVEAPQTAYEKAFYPKCTYSQKAIKWLEFESEKRGIHIHNALCGHGGEHEINDALVDGYHPESKTVFQFQGCYWHGCLKCYTNNRNLPKIKQGKFLKSYNQVYNDTIKRTESLKMGGYRVITEWECDYDKTAIKYNFIRSPRITKTFPHAIVYDFEALHDKSQAKNPTASLSYSGAHVPVSVSISDTLETAQTFLCNGDPKELINQFVCELERRQHNIQNSMSEYLPPDRDTLPQQVRQRIISWCNQVPVVGFNSGRYDLNLIKTHFVGRLAQDTNIKVAKKANTTMFLITDKFRFLDIINYLGPGTSYASWIKAYGCVEQKSWFPYEWFDHIEKLNYPGLPDYEHWFSKLKNEYLLTPEELKYCKNIFQEKGLATFRDWLEYYNNLDVGPFIEALQKMKAFYSAKDIDILKDAVSLPGVSLQYLLRGSIEAGADLYSPCLEAYEMLKGAVVGGPSIVFCRYHEAGKTKIRNHKYGDESKPCKKIIGYDANALYLSTMLKEMPCGKENVVSYKGWDTTETIKTFQSCLESKEWFGFGEVDIEIPQNLWSKFEEMPPFFYNKQIPDVAIPQNMKDYLKKTGRKQMNSKKLVGALSGDKILLFAPLIKWYLDHGAVITRLYRTLDYSPEVIFQWFVEKVTEARRMGDKKKELALLADIFKLLGNAAYGKLIEALERQNSVIYTTKENDIDKALRSPYFDDLEEIGDAYEVTMRKRKIEINRPFQVGIAVYQLAKLRMLEFYYDCLDRFIHRSDFELIQMDTDSNYIALSGLSFDELVKPEMKERYELEKNSWFPRTNTTENNKWDQRTPGLFKAEFEGHRAIALCSKAYFVENLDTNKYKASAKGMSKKQNAITWKRYKDTLEGSIDKATNRGFRTVNNKMMTYEQTKLGVSAYYDKRYVTEDGIHTEPIEYHMSET